MPFFDDVGFYKRAQIAAHDLTLAGVASFDDLDRCTIFADNLVPHVLRVDGVLRYAPELAGPIDACELLHQGPEEREIRACAVHACELLAERLGLAPRVLDGRLWNRGQEPRYKARPRHRTRCVWY
jgi:Potential Queuosine, Q, salvage protein family